jgi:nicotinate-nucleotide adenylyltransferase
MNNKKTVLFGGTFDPIHIGHTKVAQVSAQIIGADNVIFIPAKKSPLKTAQPQATDEDRLQMIRLAIADIPKFEVHDYEIRKAAQSFTIDTVRFFKTALESKVQLYWLMGTDNISDLVHWHKITELIDECNLAVMFRAGCPMPDFSRFEKLWGADRIAKLQRNIIGTPLVNISSTEIRRKLSAGENVSSMVAPAVLKYIHTHNLYREQKKTAQTGTSAD